MLCDMWQNVMWMMPPSPVVYTRQEDLSRMWYKSETNYSRLWRIQIHSCISAAHLLSVCMLAHHWQPPPSRHDPYPEFCDSTLMYLTNSYFCIFANMRKYGNTQRQNSNISSNLISYFRYIYTLNLVYCVILSLTPKYSDYWGCRFVFLHFCIFTKIRKYETADVQKLKMSTNFGSYFRNIDIHVVVVWCY